MTQDSGFWCAPFHFFFTTVIVEFQFHIPVLTEVLVAYVMLFPSIESFLGKLREAGEAQPPRQGQKEKSCYKLSVCPACPRKEILNSRVLTLLLGSQMAHKEWSRTYLKGMNLVQINIAKNWPLVQQLGIGRPEVSLFLAVTKELHGLASSFICLSLSCPSGVMTSRLLLL